jgi:hypothetical protein
VVVDQALREHALEVAEGDQQRVVLRPDGSVIVANNLQQAKQVLRDDMFGAVAASDTVSRLEDDTS